MLIVSKCTQCGRGYTARVTSCQICGGACVPASADDAALILPRPAPEPVAKPPGAECPCCGGAPGPHTIAQRTRSQVESTLVPWRRKFLVTTVRIPGVCTACNRSLQWKRLLASALLPLPLIAFFGIGVLMDTPAAMVPVLIYIVYVLPRIAYSWTDFLLYGRELSWKLTAYVPRADKEVLATYPAGLLHIVLRFVFLPVLAIAMAVLAFSLFAVVRVFNKPEPTPAAATAAASPEAEPAKVAPATTAPGRKTVSTEVARVFFNTTQAIAVPVDAETIAQPALGRPATTIATVDGKSLVVVKVYGSEPKVPANVSYQLMTGSTVVAKFAAIPCDGLLVVDWDMFVSPEQMKELVGKMDKAPTTPKAIRVRH